MSFSSHSALAVLLPAALLIGACGGEEPAGGRITATLDQPEASCPALGTTIGGTVTEVAHVSRYTYVKLDRGGDEVWAAVRASDVEVGDAVRVVHARAVDNFRSPSTGRVFSRLYLGYLAAAEPSRSSTPGSCPARPRAGQIAI